MRLCCTRTSSEPRSWENLLFGAPEREMEKTPPPTRTSPPASSCNFRNYKSQQTPIKYTTFVQHLRTHVPPKAGSAAQRRQGPPEQRLRSDHPKEPKEGPSGESIWLVDFWRLVLSLVMDPLGIQVSEAARNGRNAIPPEYVCSGFCMVLGLGG